MLSKATNESVSVWRKRIFLRDISYVKLGNNVRVKQEDLERWVEERRVETATTE